MSVFTEDELSTLKRIVQEWEPNLVRLLTQSRLTDDECEDLRGALAEELAARGLDEDHSEPNRYGLQIEDLIDKVGRIPRG